MMNDMCVGNVDIVNNADSVNNKDNGLPNDEPDDKTVCEPRLTPQSTEDQREPETVAVAPQKRRLFDGTDNNPITAISILGMYRNDEMYLKYLTKTLTEFEQTYDVQFSYYFIENNSTDRTREVLKEFMATRKGRLLLWNLKKDYKNVGDGRNYDRIKALAKVRNKLVDSCVPFTTDWCLFIDSNIFFPPDILDNVFTPSREPTKNNIGMMTMYTQQMLIPNIHKIKSDRPVLVNHYYDTYPFVDMQDRTHYPYCAFEHCGMCQKHRKGGMNRSLISSSEKTVDVKSAFGGFVFVRGDILNDKRIRWDTFSYEITKDESVCEHVFFCDRLRLLSGKRIVVLLDVNKLYRTV